MQKNFGLKKLGLQKCNVIYNVALKKPSKILDHWFPTMSIVRTAV